MEQYRASIAGTLDLDCVSTMSFTELRDFHDQSAIIHPLYSFQLVCERREHGQIPIILPLYSFQIVWERGEQRTIHHSKGTHPLNHSRGTL